MSTLGEIRQVPGPGQRRVAARLAAAIGWCIQLGRAYRGRRVVAQLARLDDRMLCDIGLSRSDLRDAAAEPLPRDPTRVLFRRAAERRAARERVSKHDADAGGECTRRNRFIPYY